MDKTPAKMTPREYAKYRSSKLGLIIQPQLIYYYIRKGSLPLETCDCGRRVLAVKLADDFFDERDKR